MNIVKTTKILNQKGNNLQINLVIPEKQQKNYPLIIMLTGDGKKGSKSLTWINLSEKLANRGISSLLFDFAGLGDSEGKREDLTLTQGISDFRVIYEFVKTLDFIDRNNIGVLASSFGGSVAISCYEILNSIKAVGLKSPCCFLPDAYINEISSNAFSDWTKNKYCEENGYGIEVLLDAFKYNIYNAAQRIKTPCVITHGTDDEIVPINQSKYLNMLLKCPHHFWVFNNCDHGYSVDGAWDKMANIFIEFFAKELLGEKNG